MIITLQILSLRQKKYRRKNMKYTLNTLEDKRIEITINVEKKEWDDALSHAYEETKGKYNVQGFRKGHAPRRVIEKTYGDTVFYDEAIDHCFYRYYFEVLSKEKTLEPVSSPEVNVSKIDENGLELKLKITNKPEVTLGEYKGLKVELEKIEVTDGEVEHELEHMREHRVRFVEVDRSVKNGDHVTIDFSGSVDGVKFDGGTATDYDLEIGSHSFIDNFEEQLLGLNKGDKKDVNVTFPEEYHAENLKGKKAVFEVVIKAIKEKVYPEINDSFADEVSEFSTLAELKEDLKKKIHDRKEREAKAKQENKLIDMIVDASKVEVPEVMVNEQVDSFIKDFEYRLSYQGLNLQGYLDYSGMTLDALKASRKEDAKKTVKTRLVLSQIINNEKIIVTEKDIEDKFNENAKDKKSIDDIKKTLGEEQFAYMENSLLLNKLMSFLKENNTL